MTDKNGNVSVFEKTDSSTSKKSVLGLVESTTEEEETEAEGGTSGIFLPTFVATYVYSRDVNLVHRYHFALHSDGSPVIFYSENNRMYPPISREAEDSALKEGFAAIVNQ